MISITSRSLNVKLEKFKTLHCSSRKCLKVKMSKAKKIPMAEIFFFSSSSLFETSASDFCLSSFLELSDKLSVNFSASFSIFSWQLFQSLSILLLESLSSVSASLSLNICMTFKQIYFNYFNFSTKTLRLEGSVGQWLVYLLLDPAAPGSDLGFEVF